MFLDFVVLFTFLLCLQVAARVSRGARLVFSLVESKTGSRSDKDYARAVQYLRDEIEKMGFAFIVVSLSADTTCFRFIHKARDNLGCFNFSSGTFLLFVSYFLSHKGSRVCIATSFCFGFTLMKTLVFDRETRDERNRSRETQIQILGRVRLISHHSDRSAKGSRQEGP